MEVYFGRNPHRYWDSSGNKLESVSSVIKPYKGEFDPEAVSLRKALSEHCPELYSEYKKDFGWDSPKIKTEINQLPYVNFRDDIVDIAEHYTLSWDKKSEYGTLFHDKKELEDIERGYTIHNGDKIPMLKKLVDYPKGVCNMNSPDMYYTDRLGYYPEFIAYCLDLGIAGQVDRLVIDPPYFDIDDWKTDSDIKFSGFRNNTLKEPLSHLQDCNYSVYSMKISIYAYLVNKMTGLIPRELFFTHVEFEEESIFLEEHEHKVVKETKYPVMYREWEVKNILKR